MARVTVEDCIDKVTNRFELVMVASQRARNIGSGAALMVDRDRDKNTVVSLHEIAEEHIIPADIKENMVRNYQRVTAQDDMDEDVIDHMHGELEWGQLVAADASDFAALDDEDGEDIEDGDFDDLTNPLEELAGGFAADEE